MALPIEGIHLCFFWVVETFVRKIFYGAIKLEGNWLIVGPLVVSVVRSDTDYLSPFYIPEEVVVRPRVIVEEVDEQFLVVDPAAGNEWVLEVLICHREAVYSQCVVNIQLSPLDLLGRPGGLAKDSQLEEAVVEINYGELGAIRVLLNLLDLDVLVRQPADLLLKRKLVGVQVVHLYERFAVVFLCYGNRSSGVIGYNHRHDRPFCDNCRLFQQVREYVLVIQEAHIWFDCCCVTLRIHINNRTRIIDGRLIFFSRILRLLIIIVFVPSARILPLLLLLMQIVEVFGELVLLLLNLVNGLLALILLPAIQAYVYVTVLFVVVRL